MHKINMNICKFTFTLLVLFSFNMFFFDNVNLKSFACDDIAILFSNKANPKDIVASKLAKVSQILINIGKDLEAYNQRSAYKQMEEVLKIWIEIDNIVIQSPPKYFNDSSSTSSKDINLIEIVKYIATLLGEINMLIKSQKLFEAHDIIERIVCKMSALAALIINKSQVYDMLEIEYKLYKVKDIIKKEPFLKEEFDSECKLIVDEIKNFISKNNFDEKLKDKLYSFIEDLSNYNKLLEQNYQLIDQNKIQSLNQKQILISELVKLQGKFNSAKLDIYSYFDMKNKGN